jgi:hypothetical protein
VIKDAQELFDPDSVRPDETDAFLDTPTKTNDPVALKKKALSDKQKSLADENDLRELLKTRAGVRFIARLIGGPCGWNMPYFHGSNSVMCEIAGRRSVGFQLEQWISDVDLSLWFAVRRELEILRPKPKTSGEKFKSGAA